MERFSVLSQATYSELLSSLLNDEGSEWSAGGSLVRLEVKGRGYWYHQTKAGGRIHKRSLGPDTDGLRKELPGMRADIERARERAKGRQALVRQLRAAGYPAVDPLSGRVLAAMASAGVFRLHGVLVGTYAFRAYPPMLGVRLPEVAAVTSDIDLAQRESLSVAVDPRERVRPSFEAVLKGVDATFESVPGFGRPPKPTRWRLGSGQLSVELLTPMLGPSNEAPRLLPALNAHAAPLRFLDFLLEEPEPVALLWRSGILARVPAPARYGLHKLLVAQRRRTAERAKRGKDLAQADALLAVLRDDDPDELERCWRDLLARGPKWRQLALKSVAKLAPETRNTLSGWA